MCHAFTTLATGGFSTRSASIEAYGSPLIEWVLIVFMALGGTSFLFVLKLIDRKWNLFKFHKEVAIYYGFLGAVSSLVIFAFLEMQYGWEHYSGEFASGLFSGH